jgi:hypothetical protein
MMVKEVIRNNMKEQVKWQYFHFAKYCKYIIHFKSITKDYAETLIIHKWIAKEKVEI